MELRFIDTINFFRKYYPQMEDIINDYEIEFYNAPNYVEKEQVVRELENIISKIHYGARIRRELTGR